MSTPTDQVLAKYVAEIEERQRFIDGVLQSANGEDLSDEKLELVTEARNRIERVNGLMQPLEEARRISGDSAERIAQLAKYMSQDDRRPTEFEYRSIGEYVIDRWRAGLGNEEAVQRLDLYHRAAAHQTTADNPGLIPTKVLGPVVNFIDAARPLVSVLGPRQLPGGSWARPRVTQHTQVAKQTGEKQELVSQKMLITSTPVTPTTWGGYVNISRQNIDFTQPEIMDLVINDLAAQYALQTENDLVDGLVAAATAGATLPTGANTAAEITAAIWAAVGAVYAAAPGAGRPVVVIPPQMLGLIGPMFAPVNPTNSQSQGFSASDYAQGLVGAISGVPVYVTAAMASNTMLVLSTAAAEVYEDRIGSLQVVEPSVLGIQVAYAGYFAWLALQPTAIIKITKTP